MLGAPILLNSALLQSRKGQEHYTMIAGEKNALLRMGKAMGL